MKRPATMMKRPAAADRVADTAPDWLVAPDPTAQLYVLLVVAATLVNGNDETESSGDVRPPPLVDTARQSCGSCKGMWASLWFAL